MRFQIITLSYKLQRREIENESPHIKNTFLKRFSINANFAPRLAGADPEIFKRGGALCRSP